eukprot:7148151-Pyramimonas_sp.AAC.1
MERSAGMGGEEQKGPTSVKTATLQQRDPRRRWRGHMRLLLLHGGKRTNALSSIKPLNPGSFFRA